MYKLWPLGIKTLIIHLIFSWYSGWTHHLTAKFCTSPFLSSSRRNSIFTTFLSESSSSLMLSFCNSVIKSFVAMNLKSLSLDVICQNVIWFIKMRKHFNNMFFCTIKQKGDRFKIRRLTFSRRFAIWYETLAILRVSVFAIQKWNYRCN